MRGAVARQERARRTVERLERVRDGQRWLRRERVVAHHLRVLRGAGRALRGSVGGVLEGGRRAQARLAVQALPFRLLSIEARTCAAQV